MTALASNCTKHFRLLWNHWMEFNETWQEARSQRLLSSLCLSNRSEKQDGHPCLWLAETFSTSLKQQNGIQRNLTGSKISISPTKYVFSGRSEKEDGRSGHRLADTFSSLNRWIEFNKTWQEARSHRQIPSLCIFGPIGERRWPPGLWLSETFSTSPLNGLQRNLTGKPPRDVICLHSYDVCKDVDFTIFSKWNTVACMLHFYCMRHNFTIFKRIILTARYKFCANLEIYNISVREVFQWVRSNMAQ